MSIQYLPKVKNLLLDMSERLHFKMTHGMLIGFDLIKVL